MAASDEAKTALLRGAVSAPVSPQAGPDAGKRQPASHTGNNLPMARHGQRNCEEAIDTVIDSVAKHIDKFLRSASRELRFTIDRNSGKSVITVYNSQTGEIVRRIPPQELLEMHRRINAHPDRPVRGLLFNSEA